MCCQGAGAAWLGAGLRGAGLLGVTPNRPREGRHGRISGPWTCSPTPPVGCSQWAGPPRPCRAGQGGTGSFNEAPLRAQNCRLSGLILTVFSGVSFPVCPPWAPAMSWPEDGAAPPQLRVTPIVSGPWKAVLQLFSPGVGLGGLQSPRRSKATPELTLSPGQHRLCSLTPGVAKQTGFGLDRAGSSWGRQLTVV